MHKHLCDKCTSVAAQHELIGLKGYIKILSEPNSIPIIRKYIYIVRMIIKLLTRRLRTLKVKSFKEKKSGVHIYHLEQLSDVNM